MGVPIVLQDRYSMHAPRRDVQPQMQRKNDTFYVPEFCDLISVGQGDHL